MALKHFNEPTFKKLENGRFKCVETGHELPAHGRDSYARSKHCRLGLIDAALASKKPPLNMFSQDPLSKSKLKCKLTGLTVNKSEEHIWKHINGKRFLRMLEKKEAEQEMPDRMGKAKEESHDPEEAEFWMPPVGERWDFDDGGNRWGSGSESEPENDDANGEGNLVQILNHLPLLTPDLSSHKYRIEEVLGYYQRSSCKTCSYVVSIFLVLPPDELIEEATHET
nr:surfeit locus protein 2 [Ipomoea batatas]